MWGRNSQLPSDLKFLWQGLCLLNPGELGASLLGVLGYSLICGVNRNLIFFFFVSKLRAKVPGAFLRASELDTTIFPSKGVQVKRQESRGQDHLK